MASNTMFVNAVTMLIIVIGIVYVSAIPKSVRMAADSIPGRLVLFTAIIAMYKWLGWTAAVLLTLFSLLLLAGGIYRQSEGFTNMLRGEAFTSDIDIVDSKDHNKWWDEKILGRETIIKNQLVNTQPIQG